MLTFAVAKPRVAASASAGMETSARSAIAPYNFFFTFVSPRQGPPAGFRHPSSPSLKRNFDFLMMTTCDFCGE
jgi:hypothetical protein